MALSTVFLAPLAASGETTSNLDGPPVDVPGWQAAKVSGEATGCHSEIEENVDPSVLNAGVNSSQVSALDAAATEITKLSDALPDNVGFLKQLFDATTKRISSVTSQASGGVEVFHQEAGPVPTVKLPWQGGGPVSESENDCTLDLFGVSPITLAKDLKVSTVGAIGAAGYSHTESESSDNFGLIYIADKVDTECLATLADIEAKTDVSDGQYIDIQNAGGGNITASVKDIPESPKKNDELTDFSYSTEVDPGVFLNIDLSLTANEQDDEKNAVTVTGLHAKFKETITENGVALETLTWDGIRDQSHCDIDPQPTAITVEPKFTG